MIELRRRSFVTGLVALVAAPAVVKAASLMKVAPTEKLLTLDDYALTMQQITREAVRRFRDCNPFMQAMDAQYERSFLGDDQQWGGAKIGSQLRIRLPADYTVTDGPALSMQDTVERQVVLFVSGQSNGIWPGDVVDKAAAAVALAVATPVVLAKVLEQPVTRRFWGLPQHSAADQEG